MEYFDPIWDVPDPKWLPLMLVLNYATVGGYLLKMEVQNVGNESYFCHFYVYLHYFSCGLD